MRILSVERRLRNHKRFQRRAATTACHGGTVVRRLGDGTSEALRLRSVRMFGVHFLQSSPTTYVMRYKNGRVVDFGLGLTLLYFGPGINDRADQPNQPGHSLRLRATDAGFPRCHHSRQFDLPRDLRQNDWRSNWTFRLIGADATFRMIRIVCRSGWFDLIQSQTHTFTRDQPLRRDAVGVEPAGRAT